MLSDRRFKYHKRGIKFGLVIFETFCLDVYATKIYMASPDVMVVLAQNSLFGKARPDLECSLVVPDCRAQVVLGVEDTGPLVVHHPEVVEHIGVVKRADPFENCFGVSVVNQCRVEIVEYSDLSFP
ncbi:hypothetical protein [Gemmata massiliana]|uniref:hypothetical protein n=1 Tax=Gemmata massiliana TaxID=1210884 RepID=UPI001E2E8B08|nr:hypothetical protein [Gemmata massiliana]